MKELIFFYESVVLNEAIDRQLMSDHVFQKKHILHLLKWDLKQVIMEQCKTNQCQILKLLVSNTQDLQRVILII
ncbi:unnamed protein product [Paramecium octaurelia]|uniref:Uncharacterized protein n=1 Tax=Paramecium octaurelia TaxID=43137 RepID=A0A8S1T716_PAROT|nr:unnamed protein product [Paramecium octaurelia]